MIQRVAAGQDGVVTAAQCHQAGVPKQQVNVLCRTKQWARLAQGTYLVNADILGGEPPRRALIRAALLSAGPYAVAVLGTAAELLGIAGVGMTPGDVFDVNLPGDHARPQRLGTANLRLHQLTLRAGDTTLVDGLPVTTPARTVADLMLRLDRFGAVSVLDSALNRHLVLPDELDLVRAYMRGRRGAVRTVPWLREADTRAESPLETRVRLRAVDGGVPPDELQFRVRDRNGEVVAIGDLAWLGARIIGEADGGEAHENPQAVFRDRVRQNAIIAAGYTPLRFTWRDTMTPDYVPYAVRAAMQRRGKAA
jgi:very-short-patch-repair endonuclease